MANISSINGNPIVVPSSGIADGAVSGAKLADGAVTSAKLGAEQIETGHLSDQLRKEIGGLFWEVGSVSAQGADLSASNRIRTTDRLHLTEGTNVRLWCDEDYKFALCVYADGAGYYGTDYWHGNVSDGFQGAKGFTFWGDAEIRLVLARVDNADMTADESTAMHMDVYAPSRLDVAHGNWTVGSISTNGTDHSLSSYVNFNRTTGYYRFSSGQFEVEFAAGYSGRWYQYEDDLSYVQRSSLLGEGAHVVTADDDALYRFQVSYGSDTTARLDPQDADNAVIVREISGGGGGAPHGSWADEDERMLQQVRYSSASKSAKDTVTLLHFSDIHGDADRTERILKFAADHSDAIDDVLFTGDLVEADWGDDSQWWGTVGAGGVLVTLGNHDYIEQGGDFDQSSDYKTMDEAYDRYFGGFSSWGAVAGGTKRTYWYKDYASSSKYGGNGVRLIGLDLVLEWGVAPEDSAQYLWFQQTLASARTAGRSVVIAEHFPAFNQAPLEDAGPWYHVDYAYGQKSRWKVASHWPDAVEAFVDAGGEFVCWLAGHTHSDLLSVNSEYPSQMFVVIDTGNPGKASPFSDTARAADTPTQDCFNVIGIDTRLKTIRIVRIGASENMRMQRKKALCINYANATIVGMG